jgi:septal ring factor EnvC (AmiA/AmiB activator)
MRNLLTHVSAALCLFLLVSGCGRFKDHSDRKDIEDAFHDVGRTAGEQEQRIKQLEEFCARQKEEKSRMETVVQLEERIIDEKERRIKDLEERLREKKEDNKHLSRAVHRQEERIKNSRTSCDR